MGRALLYSFWRGMEVGTCVCHQRAGQCLNKHPNRCPSFYTMRRWLPNSYPGSQTARGNRIKCTWKRLELVGRKVGPPELLGLRPQVPRPRAR